MNIVRNATFLDLDIKIIGDKFVYKLYDKRDEFPFFTVHIPDRRSNILFEWLSSIFHGAGHHVMTALDLFYIFTLSTNSLISRTR